MTNDEIEELLKAEIRWAIDEGPGWDPNSGAWWRPDARAWRPFDRVQGPTCGTCAIGALLCRRQPEPVGEPDDVVASLAILGRPLEWVETLYYGVADQYHNGPMHESHADAHEMACRLRTYGDEYAAAKKAREAQP